MSSPLVSLPIFLRDAQRIGLPSAATLLRMRRDEGLVIHTHPTRGKFIKLEEYAAHMDAMAARAAAQPKRVPPSTIRGRK